MASAPFDANDFCANPSLDQHTSRNINKGEWKAIVKHFEVPIDYQMTKEVIKNSVIEHLVNNNILNSEAIEVLTPMSSSRLTRVLISHIEHATRQWEIEKLKLEYQWKTQEM